MLIRKRDRLAAWIVGFLLVVAQAASGDVPTRVPFQGLLLDAAGTPLNASVDLDFELFDALTDGSSLWTESHPGVIVVDGVYSVELGETIPMTTSIFSAGTAFLEIKVSGETLVPRQQLLSVPYALSAESVGGVSSSYYEQIFENFEFDGGAPPNFHPDEGLADSDGDGIANFVDPDNDQDGVNDEVELGLGTPINVANPRIQLVSPSSIPSYANTTLTVTGTGLQTVSSVSFGAELPAPYNITPTSFDIDVTAPTAQIALAVAVSLGNGQSDVSNEVAIQPVAPTITGFAPPIVPPSQATTVTIRGTGFFAGSTVQIGSQNLVPTSISATEMTVDLAAEPEGSLAVLLSHPNGLTADSSLVVAGPDAKIVFVTSNALQRGFFGVVPADANCQNLAATAGLSGTFKAWLSESQASPTTQSPSTTFDTTGGPYVTSAGALIADDWADLTDGTLLAPIDSDESGHPITGPASFSVWTGTDADGTALPSPNETCNEWSQYFAAGAAGSSSSTTSQWSFSSTLSCNTILRLYCFEQ